MKKKFFSIFVLGVLALCIYACSGMEGNKVAEQEEYAAEVAFDELTNRIAALDMQYVGSDPQTRGRFWNFFKRLVGCDAGGAALGAGGGFIGAIVGAILGSIMGVSIYVHEQSVCMSIQNANQEIAAQLELYDAADTVGLIHNQIISEIFNEKGEAIYSLSQNDLKELILDKVEKHCGPISLPIMEELSELDANVQKMIKVFQDEDLEASMTAIVDLIPERQNEIMILDKYYSKLKELSSDQEVVEYTNKFNQLVDDSAISKDSKDFIGSAVSVGANSNLLWDGANATEITE